MSARNGSDVLSLALVWKSGLSQAIAIQFSELSRKLYHLIVRLLDYSYYLVSKIKTNLNYSNLSVAVKPFYLYLGITSKRRRLGERECFLCGKRMLFNLLIRGHTFHPILRVTSLNC